MLAQLAGPWGKAWSVGVTGTIPASNSRDRSATLTGWNKVEIWRDKNCPTGDLKRYRYLCIPCFLTVLYKSDQLIDIICIGRYFFGIFVLLS